MAVHRLFQPASALFQPASALLVLAQWPGAQLNLQESSTMDGCRLIRGCGLNRGVRGAPEPRPV